jgi:tetratricopeptide (TPR) repeat protein
MTRACAWILCAALLGGAARADERTDKARLAFETGMAHFNLDEYDAAIVSFQEAYRQKPDPVFLYNIAQAARLANRADMAIEYYEKYMHLAPPRAPNVDVASKQAAALRKLRAAQDATIGARPRTTMAPDSRGGRADEPSSEPAPREASPPARESAPPPAAEPAADSSARRPDLTVHEAAPDATATAARSEPTPIYKRWWLWAGIVAVVVIAGAVAIGVAATSGGPSLPSTTYGPVSLSGP